MKPFFFITFAFVALLIQAAAQTPGSLYLPTWNGAGYTKNHLAPGANNSRPVWIDGVMTNSIVDWAEITGKPTLPAPAGTGTELQFRNGASTFGAITGSSFTGGVITLPDYLVVARTGATLVAGGLRALVDPLNTNVEALYLLPTHNSGRVFIGRGGQSAILNLSSVSSIESAPPYNSGTMTFGGTASHAIYRTSNRIIIHAAGGSSDISLGVDSSGFNSWSEARTHATLGPNRQFRYFNTRTSATNWEAGTFDWHTTSNTLRLGSDVGSGGGTARDVHFIRGGQVRERHLAAVNVDDVPRRLPSYQSTNLPAANSVGPGALAICEDADGPVVGGELVGGGGDWCIVVSNGAAWYVMMILPP